MNVSITAVSGATVIIWARNAGVSINEWELNIEKPYVFHDGEGYRVYVGIEDSEGISFTLKRGEDILDCEDVTSEGELYLVLEPSIDPPIENPTGINLEVQKDGITVIYENLELK